MKIRNLKIEGYKNLNIELVHNSDIIALIGNNGSGKSNLLEALSLIFRSLYKKSDPTTFDYTIEYIINGITNVNINKQKSKIVFKVNGVQAVSVDEYLPKKVIAIYSGEEQRLWEKIFKPISEEFINGINLTKKKGLIFQKGLMPQMLYLNNLNWNLSLLSLLVSDLEDNKKFIKEVLKINSIEKIKFEFNKKSYESYSDNSALSFVQLIDNKSEYTLQELKDLLSLIYSDSDIFNNLYISTNPIGLKLIENITILYNEHLTIEDFSEGEKKLLLIRAAFEFAEQEDSLFILDEPDAHIHLNNKDQIIKTFEPYKDKRQIVLTTHSPTVTQAIDDDNCLFMVNSGKIIERKKQEILSDLTSDFWNKHQQSSFLSSKKDLILLVEGKHDKEHITNAYEKLKDEYPNLNFDIFKLNSETNILPFMRGLYESDFASEKVYIGLFDNEKKIIADFNNPKLYTKIENKEFRKILENQKTNNNYFVCALPKPDDIDCECTIETMFDSTKFEEAYSIAFENAIGHFSNKSINSITENIKEQAKNILSENSKNFLKEDFKNFRKLFDLILDISNTSQNKNITKLKPIKAIENIKNLGVEKINTAEKVVSEIGAQIIISEPVKFISTKSKRSGRKVNELQHSKGKPSFILKIYKQLKEEILHKDPLIEIDSKVEYIAFKKNKKNVFDIKLLKSKVIMWVNKNKGELPKDLAELFVDCSEKGHHGNGDYEIHFKSLVDVEEFLMKNPIEKILEL